MRTRHLVAIFGLLFGIINGVFVTLRWKASDVDHHRYVRYQSMANVQLVLVGVSIYLFGALCTAFRRLFVANEDGDTPIVRPLSQRACHLCADDVLRGFVILFLSLTHLSYVFYFILLDTNPNRMAYYSFAAVGCYIHVAVLVLIVDLVTFVIRRFVRLFSSSSSDDTGAKKQKSKRAGLHEYAIFAAFVIAIILSLVGLLSTSRDPEIHRVDVHSRKLPTGKQFRIALLTDIHIGPTVGKQRIEQIVAVTNRLQSDAVAIAGDLADGFVLNFGEAAKPLCGLESAGGTFFATGNHEYMHGNIAEWFDFLKKCGINVLHNSQKRIPLSAKENTTSTRVCMAGADDLIAARAGFPGHKMDHRAALRGCQDDDLIVMLAHQPNAAKLILDDKETPHQPDLILSGHTHGGQFYIFVPIVHFANAFVNGLYEISPAQNVIVSMGANFFGPPIKMWRTCEVLYIVVHGSG